MRITAQAREATRARILDAARRLFGGEGFEATSTRDLAAAAGIAAGTLFNYFPTKEAVALALADEALEGARARHRARDFAGTELCEELFALTASELAALAPQRGYLAAVLETAMSPFRQCGAAEPWRAAHLELFGAALERRGIGERGGLFAAHLYWTLYLGVLAFWCADDSPNREETLAVLDRSTRLFADTLGGAPPQECSGLEKER